MSTRTIYYNLEKPDASDAYDIGVSNNNMDRIDSALHDLNRAIMGQAHSGNPITGIYQDEGALIIALSDGRRFNVGQIVGTDGAPGASVANAVIENGELLITLTNGTIFNAGNVNSGESTHLYIRYSQLDPALTSTQISTQPADYMGVYVGTANTAPTQAAAYSWYRIRGENGAQGLDGADGVSITNAEINESGQLVLRLSDASELNAGTVSTVTSVAVDTEGKLVIGTSSKTMPHVKSEAAIATSDILPDSMQPVSSKAVHGVIESLRERIQRLEDMIQGTV